MCFSGIVSGASRPQVSVSRFSACCAPGDVLNVHDVFMKHKTKKVSARSDVMTKFSFVRKGRASDCRAY